MKPAFTSLFGIVIAVLLFATVAHSQQDYKVEDKKPFMPQPGKNVLLFSKTGEQRKIILFFSKLRVNTDGTPKSYHPDDLDGSIFALNSICNGMSVYKNLANGQKEKLKCVDAKAIFRQFRANNWSTPAGYQVSWENVLAPTQDNPPKPCIFKTGNSIGYFGSLTSVKNDLSKPQRGECEYMNQLNSLELPNLVLPAQTWKDAAGVSHKSPLQRFGADKEDLVFAYNPANGSWVYGIIGDGGPPDNLGEGSLAMNMALLKKPLIPKNYNEAINLDTGITKIIVAIIPNSRGYKLAKPYTQQNIVYRGKELLKEMGFADEISFIAFLDKQRLKF